MEKIIVTGATGRMGRETVKAILKESDMKLVGVVDTNLVGEDIGEVVGVGRIGLAVVSDLKELIETVKPTIMVDFTNPNVVNENIEIAVSHRVATVVGTSGFSQEDLCRIQKRCQEYDVNALIVPNFAIGAVLMMKFAKIAARYMPQVEIIERHHDQKLDAPSGTAIKTAELIASSRLELAEENKGEFEKVKGARGGKYQGIPIHSIRLPGYVAHQEVIFGGVGQTLTIRHDSLNRESFMPGVIMAIHKVKEINGLVYGLDNVIEE